MRTSIHIRRFAALGLLPLALALAACGQKDTSGDAGKPAFRNTDITGLDYAKDFSLPDFNGKQRTLADFRGKAVIVFFGFTHCPDVCPTTMAEMAGAMQQLGPLADKVQVLFITLDPERDTPALLAKYVPSFDQRFLGLVGSPEATVAVVREFRGFYQKVPAKQGGGYSIDHTAGSYVFDPQGRIRLFVRHGQGPDAIAHDLKLLLSTPA